MLRGTFLWLSEQPAVFNFLKRNAAALVLNEKGITVSLDLLGESVSTEAETWRARRAQGFNMRVYVPFGTAWYPYLMRRLAERPANLGFMVSSVARELFSRR